MTAIVIILPVVRIERYHGDDAAPVRGRRRRRLPPAMASAQSEAAHAGTRPQQLLPSSDRRNVIELWRIREQRAFDALIDDLQQAKEGGPS